MYLDRVLLLLVRRALAPAALAISGVIAAALFVSTLSVVLIFGLLGMVLWMPLHSLIFGPTHGVPHYWAQARSQCRRFAWRWQPRLVPLASQFDETVQEMRTLSHRLGNFLLETACGAALGGFIGWICRPDCAGPAILIGVATGLALGILVALERLRA